VTPKAATTTAPAPQKTKKNPPKTKRKTRKTKTVTKTKNTKRSITTVTAARKTNPVHVRDQNQKTRRNPLLKRIPPLPKTNHVIVQVRSTKKVKRIKSL
jgi:hypothetical protein